MDTETAKETLNNALVDLAQQPKQVTVDGVTTIQQSIGDVITAIEHVNKVAAIKKNGGLGFRKIVPPGAP